MAGSARNSFGTLLKIGDGGGPEVFTTIAELGDISGPGFAQGVEETTTHDNASRYRTFTATLKELGEVSFDVNFTAGATHGPGSGLMAAFESGLPTNFQLVLPTSPAKTCTFAGIVTGYEPTAPVEGKLTASITIQGTGAPAWS